jgi:predicted DNA-binding protein
MASLLSKVRQRRCYFCLAKTDLDGNPIEGRKMRRYYQKPENAQYGLLKFRITSSAGHVRTSLMSEFNPKAPSHGASYYIEPARIPTPGGWASVPCDEVDTIVARRLLWHVHEFNEKQINVAEYEELAKSRQRERKKQVKQIDHSIRDVEERQIVLTTRLGRTKSTRAQELIERKIDRLEKERTDLIEAKRVLEEEAQNDIGSLDDELRELEACWPEYPFEKRRALINFLVQEVVLDKVSTHWIRVQVLWLHPDWGAEEMYHLRLHGKHTDWTEEEDALIREYYTSLTKPELMRLLPERTWLSIKHRGVKFKLAGRKRGPRTYRETGDPVEHLFASVAQVDPLFAYNDLAFMLENGIPLNVLDTNWERVSRPSYLKMARYSSSHLMLNWLRSLDWRLGQSASFTI